MTILHTHDFRPGDPEGTSSEMFEQWLEQAPPRQAGAVWPLFVSPLVELLGAHPNRSKAAAASLWAGAFA